MLMLPHWDTQEQQSTKLHVFNYKYVGRSIIMFMDSVLFHAKSAKVAGFSKVPPKNKNKKLPVKKIPGGKMTMR